VPAPDAAIESDSGSSCEADWECGASAYCSHLQQRCVPRCQGDVCVGPSFARDNDRLVSDGVRVCFADEGDVPGEYALRAWDGSSAQATTLTRVLGARPLYLTDGFCYFYALDALRRAPLNGGCVEVVQAMPAAQPEQADTAAAVVLGGREVRRDAHEARLIAAPVGSPQ
jgi:hypothetical protein